MPSSHCRATAVVLVYARDYPFSLMRMARSVPQGPAGPAHRVAPPRTWGRGKPRRAVCSHRAASCGGRWP